MKFVMRPATRSAREVGGETKRKGEKKEGSKGEEAAAIWGTVFLGGAGVGFIYMGMRNRSGRVLFSP